LLEKCTKLFIHDVRYQNNIKYLQLWLLYADAVAEPEEIFTFLKSNKIGTQFALFYLGWSMVLETRKKLEQAEQVLAYGIRRNASPIEDLESAIARLRKRTVASIVKNKKSADESKAQPTRAAFSRIGPASGPASPQRLQVKSARPVGSNAPKFNVFPDTAEPTVPLEENKPKLSVWNDFGTQKQRNKENTLEPSTWNQPLRSLATKVPVAPVPSETKSEEELLPEIHSATNSNFSVFVDVEPNVEPKTTLSNKKALQFRV